MNHFHERAALIASLTIYWPPPTFANRIFPDLSRTL